MLQEALDQYGKRAEYDARVAGWTETIKQCLGQGHARMKIKRHNCDAENEHTAIQILSKPFILLRSSSILEPNQHFAIKKKFFNLHSAGLPPLGGFVVV